jgi:hypothetical protein
VPVARPAPARPPYFAGSSAADSEAIISELQERIRVLEDALSQKNRTSNDAESASDPTSPQEMSITDAEDTSAILQSIPSTPMSERGARKTCIEYPLDDAVYSVTSFHAQLSLAHHGEFIGRGSLICALHSVSGYLCVAARARH